MKPKKCPYCEAEPQLVEEENVSYVECFECWLSGPMNEVTYRAVASWNGIYYMPEQ